MSEISSIKNRCSINRTLVSRLADEYPHHSWKQVTFSNYHKPTERRPNRLDWRHLSELKGVGGVYVFCMPEEFLAVPRSIILHGPSGSKVEFIFDRETHPSLDGRSIIYVGKASDLYNRFRWHFGTAKDSTASQVRNGLFNSLKLEGVHFAISEMLKFTRVSFLPLPGPENAANRDLLEITMCAKFAPPFNIKSER